MPQVGQFPGSGQTAPAPSSRWQGIEVDPRLVEIRRQQIEEAAREADQINGPRDWLREAGRLADWLDEQRDIAARSPSPFVNPITATRSAENPGRIFLDGTVPPPIPGNRNAIVRDIAGEIAEGIITYFPFGRVWLDGIGYDFVTPGQIAEDPPTMDEIQRERERLATLGLTPFPFDMAGLVLGAIRTGNTIDGRGTSAGARGQRGGFDMLNYSSRDPV